MSLDFEKSNPDEYSLIFNSWEIGGGFAQSIPTKKNTFSYDVDNQRAYDLLQNEGTGDEVAEGFIAPPLPGHSTVAGTLRNSPEIDLFVYYHWRRWLAFGLEGGYGFRTNVHIDNPGVYAQNLVQIKFWSQRSHVDAVARYGDWFGRLRPSFKAGPEIDIVQERVRVAFTDDDDPQLTPQFIISHDTAYFGLLGGVGLDLRLTAHSTLGASVEYHKVFSPLGRLDYILPKLNLSVGL